MSLDADPASGVSVYDSTKHRGQSGWWTVGITYRDITSGNNGAACLVGFDLCSGQGSWTGATP